MEGSYMQQQDFVPNNLYGKEPSSSAAVQLNDAGNFQTPVFTYSTAIYITYCGSQVLIREITYIGTGTPDQFFAL